MDSIVRYLWLIPLLPLLAAAISALLKQPRRRVAASLAIGAMLGAFVLSCIAFASTLGPGSHEISRAVFNLPWFEVGVTHVDVGFVLDPLSACMLVMITLVGSAIFIYSVGYMAHDENFTRFFCFLSLFAAAMLGLVISNSLLLFFICWELVGLASYLLIGFWYQKPSAAAAAKKAFIVTRIGDMGFFLGLLWLYAQSGTLLFYDGGAGCLENSALSRLGLLTTAGGVAVATAISLLIFCGAAGKSGQVPLHVWLPDAMEGPTPVSALIHAATMVAAGVFLIARVYPLMDVDPFALDQHSTALSVVTWVGAITAVFAALIAVAQTDIKRILAYSTVSQLGYMMMGLGVGGVAVGMFHLLTHAFFKALLFLGAGSVIHGCHGEQDIRAMGGLRKYMPVTFATYAVGMMALSGVPLFFAGFWSKDEILHAALAWPSSKWPFYLGAAGAFLTAFYMTRQMIYVFLERSAARRDSLAPAAATTHGLLTSEEQRTANVEQRTRSHHPTDRLPHESPSVMTIPLVVLAVGTVLLSFVGTPMWPWLQRYLGGHAVLASAVGNDGHTLDVVLVMLLSTVIVTLGIGAAWWIYGKNRLGPTGVPDPLEAWQPDIFAVLREKFYVDELYDAIIVRFAKWCAATADWLDRFVWGGLVSAVSYLMLGLAWVDRLIDEFLINAGFDRSCGELRSSARLLSHWQNGQIQRYLRVIGVALAVFALLFIWGCQS